MQAANVPPNPGVSASKAATTTMYLDGIPIQVPNERIADLQARGALMYGPEDLAALPDEVDLMLDELSKAVHDFTDGVLDNKQIDTSDGAQANVMQQSIRRVTARLQDIINVAYQNFPTVEASESKEALAVRIKRDAEYHGMPVRDMELRYGMGKE